MRRINLSFGAGLFLLVCVFFVSYQTMIEIIEAGKTERHVFQVQAKLNDIRNPLKDAEVGHRGFLLSGEESYLKKYSIASRNLQKQVPQLAFLLKENSEQKNNIEQLKSLISQKFAEMDKAISTMRSGNEELALDLFFKENTSNKMDKILDLLDYIDRYEENVLQSQSSQIGKHTQSAVRVIVLGSAIAFSIVLLAAYYFYAERQRRLLMEVSLRKAREDAIRASLVKSEFLANVSHEIRTPLNGIISTADLFTDSTTLGPKDKNFVGIIKSSGEALLRIVNDILDFSKVEAGKLDLEASSFSPEMVTQSATELFRARAESKKINLVFSKSDDLPDIAVGDAGRIMQVLANLIGNALKFSEQGEVHVRASLTVDAEIPNKFIKFSVRDMGVGIDEHVRSKIFEPFSQAVAQKNRKHEGTGLGLAICKKLVDLMKGSIGFESEPGKGSIFYFTIPYVVAEQVNWEPTPNNDFAFSYSFIPLKTDVLDDYTFKENLVLVAEDNITNQIVIKEHLKRFGIPCHLVSNGREALQAFTSRKYDLVFMDCQMPEMDGFEASQEIKKIDPNVPIVAMTASTLAGDKEKCIAAGMKTQLIKPIRRSDLEFTLSAHLPLFTQSRIDWSILKILAAQTDPNVVDKVVSSFLRTMPILLKRISTTNGVELRKTAHLLKSGSSTIGAVSLSKLCDQLEVAPDQDPTAVPEAISLLLKEASYIEAELQGWQKHM